MWTMCIWKGRVKQGFKRIIQWSDSDAWSEVLKFGCCSENLERPANIVAWAEPLPQRGVSRCQIPIWGVCRRSQESFFSPSSGGSKLGCLWQNTTHWPYTKHCLQYFLLTLAWFVRIFTNYKYLQIFTNYYTLATLGEESTLSNQLPQLWASWTHLFPTGQEFLTKDDKARLGFSWESNHFRVTVFPTQGRDFNYSLALLATLLAHFN